MTIGKIKLACLCAAVAAAGLWWILGDSPEERVAKTVAAAAESVKKTGQETVVEMAVKMGKLKGFFADEVEYSFAEFGQGGSMTRDEFVAQAMAVRNEFATMALSASDVSASVSGSAAVAEFAATLSGDMGGVGKARETHRVKATLVESGGNWLFSGFEIGPVEE